MRLPRTGRAALERCGLGFTLLEVLAVLVIIGIISTFAVVSLQHNTPRERLEEEGRRLQALLTLATEEAVLQGKQFGLRVGEDGYSFLLLVGEAWRELTDDPILRPRSLPEGLQLQLWVEALEVSLATPSDTEEEEVEPQIWFLSSGETIPFELTLSFEDIDAYFELTGDAYGLFKLNGPLER